MKGQNINKGLGNFDYYETYYSSRDWKVYKWLLNQIIQFSNPGKILDVGSGAGYLLEACQNWDWTAIGLEGSIDGITKMKLRNPDLNAINCMLSEKFPFNEQTFQTVIINQVIEHLEDNVQINCLNESYRVMKRGGTIIVHSPSKYNLAEKNADATHINLLAPSELKSLLVNAGFHSLIDLNNARLYTLGDNLLSKWVINTLYRFSKSEKMLATASFIAYK